MLERSPAQACGCLQQSLAGKKTVVAWGPAEWRPRLRSFEVHCMATRGRCGLRNAQRLWVVPGEWILYPPWGAHPSLWSY